MTSQQVLLAVVYFGGAGLLGLLAFLVKRSFTFWFAVGALLSPVIGFMVFLLFIANVGLWKMRKDMREARRNATPDLHVRDRWNKFWRRGKSQ